MISAAAKEKVVAAPVIAELNTPRFLASGDTTGWRWISQSDR
jgi:uncharacterized protein YfaS (alpha-2-macroglobulin family)